MLPVNLLPSPKTTKGNNLSPSVKLKVKISKLAALVFSVNGENRLQKEPQKQNFFFLLTLVQISETFLDPIDS